MIRKTKLDNGIIILSESIPQVATCSLGFWFSVGTRWDRPTQLGLAHFAEHMLFKGTKTRSALKLAQDMDLLGGRMNAFTEQEQTCFYTISLSEHLEASLELLCDMYLNSTLDPEELEREKSVVCEEIKMVEDSPDELASDIFYETIWPDHPLGKPIQGTVDIVKTFTRDMLLDYYATYFVPNRLLVSVAGNIEHEKFVELVKKYLGHLPAKVEAELDRDNLPGGLPRSQHVKIIKKHPTEQVSLCYGGQALSLDDPRKCVLSILDSVLGGSLSCRLFQEIREKNGLAYSVETFRSSYYDAGLFGVEVGTSEKNVGAVLDMIDSIFADIRREGITTEELERARQHLKSSLALDMESTYGRMGYLVSTEKIYGRYVSLYEACKLIDKVDQEQVIDLARECLDTDRYSLVILGPVD